MVYEVTHFLLSAVAGWLIPVVAACCAVCYRALSGRRMVTTALVRVAVLCVRAFVWVGWLLSR